MPFGIKNAAARFQRTIDTVFQEEILEFWMVVYTYDIIIYSETWEGHRHYIGRVLWKCIPINPTISLEKSDFGQQELLVLGPKVSGLSLAIDQNKVAAVLQNPVPKTIQQMQYFLDFASYYRNNIKMFSHITQSLYKLCSKDEAFEITKERIKHELINAPVLMLPDFESAFKLYIDSAFRKASGEALHQRRIVAHEPIEWLICYIFRKLKFLEARYGETQK
ncbi:hypothetical protein O181_021094 [Austropuccinia psidii MF-1]|uniref:Reverse transcriptase domain-containing protein n=1 Tax=Austropuccinia psidii MF-1 TaxID=1389203 RepID=A0A9Q3CA56_9BASI|nr:hypothetical protein [Austropuccinia psidii MF-1]